MSSAVRAEVITPRGAEPRGGRHRREVSSERRPPTARRLLFRSGRMVEALASSPKYDLESVLNSRYHRGEQAVCRAQNVPAAATRAQLSPGALRLGAERGRAFSRNL